MGKKKHRPGKILLIICAALALAAIALAIAAAYIVGGPVGRRAAGAGAAAGRAGLYVDGTSLRFADGEPLVMRGINHAHCWFAAEDTAALDAIASTGANAVRIVCACGLQWDTDTADSVGNMIAEAAARDMVAIVELHDGTGSDDLAVLSNIMDFWCSIADVFQGTEDYCILNIANEWCGSWDSKLWRDGYIEAIPKLREAGIKNTIMVDAAGWGQYGRSIDEYGLQIFESDPERNTMFSVHMYGTSGRYKWTIRYNLEAATKQNLCVCVGEFGYKHSDGDVKEDYLMEYCTENGIGYLGWSWKGNSGGVEYLDIATEWDGSVLSPEWGEKLINGTYGIRNTSRKKSLYMK